MCGSLQTQSSQELEHMCLSVICGPYESNAYASITAHNSLLGQISVCLYVIITAKKYVIRMHRQPKAAHFDFKGAHILYR